MRPHVEGQWLRATYGAQYLMDCSECVHVPTRRRCSVCRVALCEAHPPHEHARRPPLDVWLFWSKVDRQGPDDCWEWRGSREKQNYGYFTPGVDGQKTAKAHRIAYELVNGPIARGLYICHRCDNPPCVNPSHLFAGTPADNSSDAASKGRTRNQHRGRPPLSDDDVREIRRLYVPNLNVAQLAAQFNISVTHAYCVATERSRRRVA